MLLETERLILTELTPDMAGVLHRNSLDEDNRRYVPDEVFETEEEALDTIRFLMSQYQEEDGPLVYALLSKKWTRQYRLHPALPHRRRLGDRLSYREAVHREWVCY